jgi:hypothetical protein
MTVTRPESLLYSDDIEFVPTISQELPYPMTVVAAMWLNGQLLGISSCVSVPSKSAPAGSNVPLPLQPTSTQLTTVHSTGIDRFPFPKVRDNMIRLNACFDEEELGRDLCLMPSFSITPGAPSWDPRAWKIERAFAEKWGWLFF